MSEKLIFHLRAVYVLEDLSLIPDGLFFLLFSRTIEQLQCSASQGAGGILTEGISARA
jgi:hypothetical protein